MPEQSSVLYVEDNEQNMRLVRKFLKMGGYTLVEAVTGEEGLDVARANLPAVILMDINLPDMDGIEVTKQLKADPSTAHIPVIALTANAMHGDRERFMEAGCDDYLSKPVSKSDLLEKLEHFMSQSHTV